MMPTTREAYRVDRAREWFTARERERSEMIAELFRRVEALEAEVSNLKAMMEEK